MSIRKVIQLSKGLIQQKSRERKINKYSKFHNYTHEAEDRISLYEPFYEELLTILQEDELSDAEIKKKINNLSKNLEELINIEKIKMSQARYEKNTLFKQIKSEEGVIN